MKTLFEKVASGDLITAIKSPAFGELRPIAPAEIVLKFETKVGERYYLLEDPGGVLPSDLSPEDVDLNFLWKEFPVGTRFSIIPAEQVAAISRVASKGSSLQLVGKYIATLLRRKDILVRVEKQPDAAGNHEGGSENG